MYFTVNTIWLTPQNLWCRQWNFYSLPAQEISRGSEKINKVCKLICSVNGRGGLRIQAALLCYWFAVFMLPSSLILKLHSLWIARWDKCRPVWNSGALNSCLHPIWPDLLFSSSMTSQLSAWAPEAPRPGLTSPFLHLASQGSFTS